MGPTAPPDARTALHGSRDGAAAERAAGARGAAVPGLRFGLAARSGPENWLRRFASGALLAALAEVAAGAPVLAPLHGPTGAAPQVPWVFAGLPGQTLPATRFALERQDGKIVLRVEAAASYGNLLHPLANVPAGRLSWRWRVDKPLGSADLRSRQGDDVALKVCALFDMPQAAVPFLERQLLRLAESRTGQSLPTATLCYAWDPSWPAGSVVPNAYSPRVRYITLGSVPRSWQEVSRDLAADFVRAFGDETTVVPRVRAVAVGADADNTGGDSLGYITDLEWTPAPAR
jgi:hypothetical protein